MIIMIIISYLRLNKIWRQLDYAKDWFIVQRNDGLQLSEVKCVPALEDIHL